MGENGTFVPFASYNPRPCTTIWTGKSGDPNPGPIARSSAWSNAGYVSLDNGDFRSAVFDFSKASQLFYAAKEKHTVTQELDLCWGTITAKYYSGDKKSAKTLYREVKKQYAQFVTTMALKQLPLVWSDTTVKLIDKITADFK
jgi:hypothetical protein